MSESEIQVDLTIVDRLKPECDLLLSDLSAITPITSVVDPAVIAAEVAICAAGGACGAVSLHEAVLRLIQPAATPFERGLAMGMAMILKVRPHQRD